jgi:hypothetical protein
MSRMRRRKRRIEIASFCCLPTVALAAVWVLGANTSLLRPARVMPECRAVGLAGHEFQVLTGAGAADFDDLPPRFRPPGNAGDAWGRLYTESGKLAGVIDVRRGVEWQGRIATVFTQTAVPMWLPLALTLPLLLVAAWELYRVRASSRQKTEGVCPKCGVEAPPGAARCAECGRSLSSVDPVGQLFLAERAIKPAAAEVELESEPTSA